MQPTVTTILSGIIVSQVIGISSAKAEGTYYGYAKTCFNAVNWMAGSTTVKPAYALGDWRLDLSVCYRGVSYNNQWRINRSLTTRAYTYKHTYTSSNGDHVENNDVFVSPAYPARRNYYCDASTTDPETGQLTCYTYSLLEDFDVHTWVDSVVKEGGFPPGQPYTFWMKSQANRLPNSCAAITPFSREVRNATLLYDSGTYRLKFGLVDFEYAWPPLGWCGNPYDY